MYEMNFNDPTWDAFVNRGCINGARPPSYVVGQAYLRDAAPGGARLRMMGGSMRIPPRGTGPRSLFFTYQDCAGTSPDKLRTASLLIWFQRPRMPSTLWQPPAYRTVKVVLATSIDPVSTNPRIVNLHGEDGLIASRAVPPNGNLTLTLTKARPIAAVEIQTNHIENNLKAVFFMP